MAFTQVITVIGAGEQALHDHLAAWDSAQSGVAPGYLGARILADDTSPGRHIIEVDFSSEEEARRNNDRPDTKAWAEELRQLASGEPEFANLRQVCTTYG